MPRWRRESVGSSTAGLLSSLLGAVEVEPASVGACPGVGPSGLSPLAALDALDSRYGFDDLDGVAAHGSVRVSPFECSFDSSHGGQRSFPENNRNGIKKSVA